MRSACLPRRAIAKEKQGRAAFGGPQTQAPAGGEIERFGIGSDIGHDGGHGAAGNGFFGDPQEVPHVVDPHDDQLLRIEPEGFEARPIR